MFLQWFVWLAELVQKYKSAVRLILFHWSIAYSHVPQK